jgi:Putative zinc-finger
MNECRRVRENLVAFLAGELGKSEQENVRRHLQDCARCSRELKDVQRIFQGADMLSRAPGSVLEGVDWEAQAEKIVRAVWTAESSPRPAPRRGRFWLFAPSLRPVLAGVVGGIMIGALAMFLVLKGTVVQKKGTENLFAPSEFLDRVDLEIARRETLNYLEKSQYVLLEFMESDAGQRKFGPRNFAAEQAKDLLEKKKFLNPQLEKARMAKAKDICDQIELLFYELSQVSEGLTDAQRREIQELIEQKNLLLKIKLLRKELQGSEV